MSATRRGRMYRATAIVPLAVLSTAWTASLAGVGPTTAVADRPLTRLWLRDTQLEAASCVPEEGTGAYETLAAYGAKPGRQQKIPTEYFKMDAAVRDARILALKAQLGKRAGRDVTIDAQVDPAILGGIVIKLGSEMIDASIRTKLNRLATAMKG